MDYVLFSLEPKLAVRRLPAALTLLSVAVTFKLQRRCCAELVDVPAREARAVGAVPILFEKH
jgi:hypothetical protein